VTIQVTVQRSHPTRRRWAMSTIRRAYGRWFRRTSRVAIRHFARRVASPSRSLRRQQVRSPECERTTAFAFSCNRIADRKHALPHFATWSALGLTKRRLWVIRAARVTDPYWASHAVVQVCAFHK
jgi:hypothetical protein